MLRLVWAGAFVICLLAALASACGAASPPACDSYCQYRRQTRIACERGDGAACFAAADFALGDRDALVDESCRLGHGPACVKAGDELVDWFSPSSSSNERALARFASGCRAGEPEGCAKQVKLLRAAHRFAELRPLLGPRCDAGELASCRELARSLAFGFGGERNEPRARALLSSACDSGGDPEACALLGFLQLLAADDEKGEEQARALFTKSCQAGVDKSCALARVLDGADRSTRLLGIVLSKSPVVIEHAHPSPPPRFARVVLSVGGPFELGPARFDWFGLVEGALREVSPKRLEFVAHRMNILDMVWLPGDLVLLSWDRPRRPLSQADCEQDAGCRRGFCTPRAGYCLRASAEDCQRSEACRDAGACGFDRGECVTTEPGCRGSRACQRHGRCRLDRSGGFCTGP